MPFDGGFTHKIAGELSSAADCHIDKLYQPSRDELVFLLRKKGFAAKLLLSARPGELSSQSRNTKTPTLRRPFVCSQESIFPARD